MSGRNVIEQLALLPDYLGHHMLLTLAALLFGIVICLPLAVTVTRVKALQWPTLAFASVMQTVPGIALLALMVPLLGQIGFVPALIALILYSMLPIVRNTVTGIMGVDPAMTEAARGLGMTSMQMLWKVELPLAAPVIIAGVRTATVWVVGTATLSTPVGATSLGNYIFSGLQTQNPAAVVVGCVAAAGLAIVLDQLVRVMELAAARRSTRLGVAAGMGLLAVIAGAISPLLVKAQEDQQRPPVVIGAKPFTEQYILAELIAEVLTNEGFDADTKSSLGSTILFDALRNGDIDCYVDYSGTVWTNIMKKQYMPTRQALLAEMTDWLREKYGIVCLGALGFENTYALAVPRHVADSLRLRTINDLAPYSPSLSIGSDYEFFARPEWTALRDHYGLSFNRKIVFDPSLMYAALAEGKVDVISAYSTDGRIVDFDLVILEDPAQALPPYDAILLLSQNAGGNPGLTAALWGLIGAVDDDAMRQANKAVDSDGASVEQAARQLRESVRQRKD